MSKRYFSCGQPQLIDLALSEVVIYNLEWAFSWSGWHEMTTAGAHIPSNAAAPPRPVMTTAVIASADAAIFSLFSAALALFTVLLAFFVRSWKLFGEVRNLHKEWDSTILPAQKSTQAKFPQIHSAGCFVYGVRHPRLDWHKVLTKTRKHIKDRRKFQTNYSNATSTSYSGGGDGEEVMDTHQVRTEPVIEPAKNLILVSGSLFQKVEEVTENISKVGLERALLARWTQADLHEVDLGRQISTDSNFNICKHYGSDVYTADLLRCRTPGVINGVRVSETDCWLANNLLDWALGLALQAKGVIEESDMRIAHCVTTSHGTKVRVCSTSVAKKLSVGLPGPCAATSRCAKAGGTRPSYGTPLAAACQSQIGMTRSQSAFHSESESARRPA